MTNLRRPIHVWKIYHHETLSYTGRFVCIYGLLTTLSLLQECMESKGRRRVQEEAVVAEFKTIPEFSWKECGKPPKNARLAGIRHVPNTDFLTTRPWRSVFAIHITKHCAATRCLVMPSADTVMYYKLLQQFRSSSDVVLLRYYEFQRKEDGPELLSAVKGGTFIWQMPLDLEPRNYKVQEQRLSYLKKAGLTPP
jgi:hypothetical protein